MGIFAAKVWAWRVVMLLSAPVILLLAASTSLAVNIDYPSDGTPLGNPSVVFGPNAPNMDNSLFTTSPATGNTVDVKAGLAGHVYGGITVTPGDAADTNTVSITGGTIGSTTVSGSGNVTGGWSSSGDATGNAVTITGAGSTVRGIVFGGWVDGGSGNEASANTVTAGAGATLRDNIYGAYSKAAGSVTDNRITLSGATASKSDGIIAGGYASASFSGGMTVSDNTVTIASGSVANYSIYGGRGQSGTGIADNAVIVNGGTIANATIYGGQNINGTGNVQGNSVTIAGGSVAATIYGGHTGATGRGNVTVNTIAITGGAITGDIYAGRSNGGAVTGNAVTIGGGGPITISGNLYGGLSAGAADAFTGNTLTMTSALAASVGTVRNFETLTFDFTGNANITTLDTTATGSAKSGVILDITAANTVTFSGAITGSGDVTKRGGGTLILTGDSNTLQNKQFHIAAGTLQLGGGGAAGSVAASGYDVAAGAALAYSHSNSVTDAQPITGGGKVIQRGSGSLTLTGGAGNTFSGGTEIESGTLILADWASYGVATDPATNAGHITFTGSSGPKNIENRASANYTDNTGGYLLLANSFRTQTGAGNENHIDLRPPDASVATVITSAAIAAEGGAFYVAGGTTLHVAAGNLLLIDNTANGQSNDLYVAAGGTFNLAVSGSLFGTSFQSGIDGGGDLNISSDSPLGLVEMISSSPVAPTFHMGSTTVKGVAGKDTLLILSRENPAGPTPDGRVVFTHDDAFSVAGSGSYLTGVAGDGIVRAGAGGISIDGKAVLSPLAYAGSAASTGNTGTLTLEAPTVALTDFGLAYTIAANASQDPLGSESGVPTSNNSLLNIVSGNATLESGRVVISTTDNSSFKAGDYLVIRSNNGFVGVTDANVNDKLTAYVDGFLVNSKDQDLRGELAFSLGGDPDAADGSRTAGTTNVWFRQGVNSLSMAWTGSGTATKDNPASGVWKSESESDVVFASLQEKSGIRETHFMSGDKVYISGENKRFEVVLPQASTSPGGLASKIVVSGLVVGRDTGESTTNGGAYVISGLGGITANAATAVGRFVDSGSPDQLVPTGKLQKFGDGTLTFANTGGNTFMQGVELYGGATRIARADQLGDGGSGTAFKGDATLEALSDLTLANAVAIDPGVTGDFRAAGDAVFTYSGDLTGSALAAFAASGPGTVRLLTPGATPSPFLGAMTAAGGTLAVDGDFRAASGFAVTRGATLSGVGFLAGGVVESGGVLKPDGLTRFADAAAPPVGNPLTIAGDLTFAAGSAFDVRITQFGAGATRAPFSDSVAVIGGTVAIDPEAVLNVAIDYWGGTQRGIDFTPRQSGHFTIIDASAGIAGDQAATFILRPDPLPRGVAMRQGWMGGGLYQVWLVYDPNAGFAAMPGNSQNQSGIGSLLDWITETADPGVGGLVDRLSAPGLRDDFVRGQLDALSGDIAANALFMAVKEPWRHPFNRLESAPDDAAGPGKTRVWGEFATRRESSRHDGNAHAFTLRRHGVAVGADRWLSPRVAVGGTFQYGAPRLRQSTGEVRADDYEFGLYGMVGLPGRFDMKMYLGYSHQDYDFARSVFLPASPVDAAFAAFSERLEGGAGGHAVSASIEMGRLFQARSDFRIRPSAALDIEKAWLRGFRESAGAAALAYDAGSLERWTLRLGAEGEFAVRDRLSLKGRIQYAAQLNRDDAPSVAVRFASGLNPGQPAATIRGSRIGREYLHLGMSAGWKPGQADDMLLYANYDAKIHRRAIVHAGEVGFMKTF